MSTATNVCIFLTPTIEDKSMTPFIRRVPASLRCGGLGRPSVSACLAGVLLTACGGSGDPEIAAPAPAPAPPQAQAPTPPPPPPPAVTPLAVTETNAKAAATNAYINVVTSAVLGESLVYDDIAKVGTVATTPATRQNTSGLLMRFAGLMRTNARSASGPLKSTWVEANDTLHPVSYTIQCEAGGTIDVQGTLAVDGSLTKGDRLVTKATNCRESLDEPDTVLNGELALEVVDATKSTLVIRFEATAFQYRTLNSVLTMTGDARIDLQNSSTSRTVVLSGKSLAFTATLGTRQREMHWRGYRQSAVMSDMGLSRTLEASVETRDSALGGLPVTYTVSTPEALGGVESTSGRMHVRGVGDLVLSFSGEAIKLDIDKDANGTMDATVMMGRNEMRSL